MFIRCIGVLKTAEKQQVTGRLSFSRIHPVQLALFYALECRIIEVGWVDGGGQLDGEVVCGLQLQPALVFRPDSCFLMF